LGSGGWRWSSQAYHPDSTASWPLKVLHAAFTDDAIFWPFQREARVVAQLDHANIVPIYDYSEYEGRPYLVIENLSKGLR